MNEEQLKTMLENNLITQEAYDQLLDKSDNETEQGAENGTEDDLDRRIQSAVDRATNKLGNDKKKLQEQLTKLKQEKMSEDERKAFELAEKEREIQERETRLRDKENRLYAIKALKKAGLDDGSDKSLAIVDFVLAEDEKGIDVRVKAFNELVSKLVSDEVAKTFKLNGGKPASGIATAGGENPYRKETYNLTKQMEIEKKDPDLANQLMSQAGGQ